MKKTKPMGGLGVLFAMGQKKRNNEQKDQQ
jgi:hypothetical protein